MQNILIIDDEQERHDWFAATLASLKCRVFTALDATQALEHMFRTQFDLAFFDHDLGFSKSGSHVASHVLGRLSDEREYKCPRAVWVHSHNREGALNIESKFKGDGIHVYMQEYGQCKQNPGGFVAVVKLLLHTQAATQPSNPAMSLPEKRSRINVRNLAKFFGGKNKDGQARLAALEDLEPSEFMQILKLYLKHRDTMEHIFAYVRRYKQAAQEVSEDDVIAAANELKVRDVMES